MLPALASIEAFEERLGVSLPADSGERRRAQAALDDVSALVRNIVSHTWVNSAGDLDGVPDAVRVVVLAAARRTYENPANIIQKTAADVSLSYAGRGDSAVAVTDSEIATIRRAIGETPGGIGVVRTTRGYRGW